MNELEQKYIDSREVAEMVGKQHNDLLKDIRRYVEQLGEGKITHTDFSQKVNIRTSLTERNLATLSQRKVANLSHTN